MAKTIAEWAAQLVDGMSGPAKEAASALDELRESISTDKAELGAMQKAMRDLKSAGGKQFQDQIKSLKLAIDQKKQAIGEAQASMLKMGQVYKGTSTQGAAFREVLGDLQARFQAAPGPLGAASKALGAFIGQMSTGKAKAIAFSLAFLSVAGAIAVFTKRMLESAIASQDARRDELLHFEALTKMRNLYGIAAGKASDMQAAVDKVSASVSLSRGEVASLGEQIYKSGARGKNFETILEAAAIKSSALGTAAGSAFAGFAVAVGHAGGSVKRAAEDVKNRFGGVVQAKMQSLTVQAIKQKEAFDSLFSGIDIGPFLKVKKTFTDFFSQTTASGRAIKSIMTVMLTPLLGAITTVMGWARRFFKQMLIGGQELIIAWMTVRLWFKRTFGGPETESVWKKFFGLVQWGRFLVYILAAGFGALAVGVIAATWPFWLAAAAVYGLYEIVQQLYDLWNEIDWSGLGTAIMDGIVGGIKKTWEAVSSVASDLAGELQTAFKTALGIASPSKVFAELGFQIPQGVKQGIEKGKPDATGAASKLVDAPNVKLPSAPTAGSSGKAAAARGGGGGTTVTIQSLTVTAPAGADAQAFAESVRRELETVLAGLAIEVGAGA